MNLLRRFSLFALVAFTIFGFGVRNAQANCSWAGIPNETALVYITDTTLDAAQNNLTVSIGGTLSGDRNSSVAECFQDTGGDAPFCTWAGVSQQTVPASTVSVTSGPAGLSGQTISVTVIPGQSGTGCFDPGTETRFNGSKTFNVSALANGTYNFTLQVTDTFGQSDTVNGSFTINRATTYALSVSKAGTGSGTVTGTGISCGSDCSESYVSGTSVTLSQSASAGSTFAGWSGACSGTGACTVTMNAAKSVTATFNTSGTAPTCSGPGALAIGQSGTYSASGGTGSYTWNTGGGSACSAGSSCATSYTTSGSKTITVTSGTQSSNCTVTVGGGEEFCSQISVVSDTATNWLIGGPQTDGQYIHSPSYPTYVTSGSAGTDSSGNPLPTGTYGIQPATLSGYTGPTITPSANQTCNVGGSITFNLDYTAIGEPPPPPPGGALACSGPTALGLNQNGTFSAAGGSGTYAWTASGANPASGSGASFTTNWATIGSKVVNLSGGGSDYCTVCVGGPGACTTTVINLSCSPAGQTVQAGQTATVNGGGLQAAQSSQYSWTAAGGTPSSGSGTPFSTSYSTTGTKTITVNKSGLVPPGFTYNPGICSVTVTPASQPGTVIVSSNKSITWTVTGPSSQLTPSPSPSMGQTYTSQAVGLYTISNVPDISGFTKSISASSQSLSSGGSITFTVTYTAQGGGASVDLKANGSDTPGAVETGSTIKLDWTGSGLVSNSCAGSVDWSVNKLSESGTRNVDAAITTNQPNMIFTITCDAQSGGTVDDTVTIRLTQCSDGLDNDGQNGTDYPQDAQGCDSLADDLEASQEPPVQPPFEVTECSDGLDNDGDDALGGGIDFSAPSGHQADPQCTSPQDDSERGEPDIREI